MRHQVYRNLGVRDTLFGLTLVDIVIVASVLNIVLRFNKSDLWIGKLSNFAIVGLTYIFLVLIKRYFPKGYIQNMVKFLFKTRRFLPNSDKQLNPFRQVAHEKKAV
jgi:hypothetical protein